MLFHYKQIIFAILALLILNKPIKKGHMKLNKIKKYKKKISNKKFRKISLFELQNSPKALLFRVRT